MLKESLKKLFLVLLVANTSHALADVTDEAYRYLQEKKIKSAKITESCTDPHKYKFEIILNDNEETRIDVGVVSDSFIVLFHDYLNATDLFTVQAYVDPQITREYHQRDSSIITENVLRAVDTRRAAERRDYCLRAGNYCFGVFSLVFFVYMYQYYGSF